MAIFAIEPDDPKPWKETYEQKTVPRRAEENFFLVRFSEVV